MEREERILNSLIRIRELLKEALSEAEKSNLILYHGEISSLLADCNKGIERIETERGEINGEWNYHTK